MGEHVACIANQGKAIGDNPPDNLHDKNAACYGACQDQPFSFMRPVLVFMAMLIFDVIIVYAMNMFDGLSPPKLGCLRQLLFNVERTSVRLHPMRTKVRATTATLKFLKTKL